MLKIAVLDKKRNEVGKSMEEGNLLLNRMIFFFVKKKKRKRKKGRPAWSVGLSFFKCRRGSLIHIQMKTAPDNPAEFFCCLVGPTVYWTGSVGRSQSDVLGLNEVALITFMTVHLYSAVIHSHQSGIGSIFNIYIFFSVWQLKERQAQLSSPSLISRSLVSFWSVKFFKMTFSNFLGDLTF